MKLLESLEPGTCLCDECLTKLLGAAGLTSFQALRFLLMEELTEKAKHTTHGPAPVVLVTPEEVPAPEGAAPKHHAAADPPPWPENVGELKGRTFRAKFGRAWHEATIIGKTRDGNVILEYPTTRGHRRITREPLWVEAWMRMKGRI